MSYAERIQNALEGLHLIPYSANEHFPIANRWWYAQNKVNLNADILSDTAIVVADGGAVAAMTWLHASNSKIAKLGWTVANPELGPKKKVLAIMMALDEAERLAEKFGVRFLETVSSNSALSRIMENMGYVEVDNDKFLVKQLGRRPDADEDAI